jgi:hypothetical protein
MQEVDDVGARDHVLIQRGSAGLAHRLEPVKADHGKDLDELAIPV